MINRAPLSIKSFLIALLFATTTKGCPFRNNSGTNPCQTATCKQSSSSVQCRQTVNDHCKSTTDPACLLFTKSSTSTCPFNGTNNPCQANDCQDPASTQCKLNVDGYCKHNSYDVGCTVFRIEPGIKPMQDGDQTDAEQISTCPFNHSRIDNPCGVASCQEPTSTTCKIYVENFCMLHPTDSGCVLFDVKIKKYCPFANRDVCTSNRCDTPTSQICLAHVNQYCSNLATSFADPGCALFAKRLPCPTLFFRNNTNIEGNSCSRCAVGKTFAMLHHIGQCIDCPMGKKGIAGGTFAAPNTCEACTVGTHQSLVGQTVCIDCPVGLYGTRIFSNISSCEYCTIGTYSNESKTLHKCTDCSPGTIAASIGQTFCTECIRGTYQSAFGQGNCVDCEMGKYGENWGAIPPSSCVPCRKGTSAPDVGSISCAVCSNGRYSMSDGANNCMKCEAGTAIAPSLFSVDHDSKSKCLACAAGQTSLSGASKCTTCGGGRYNPTVGKSDCLFCPPGKVTPMNVEIVEHDHITDCIVCGAGGYTAANIGTALFHECLPCSTGKFLSASTFASNHDNVGDCKDCQVGTFSFSGSGSCK